MVESDSETSAVAEYTKLIPIISTALRLLGVYIVIVGGSTVVEDLAGIIRYWRLELTENPSSTLIDYLFSPRLLGDLAYLAGGLYLLFGGRWLIHKVFMPYTESDTESQNETDESHS
jgi:hypothetical protein